MPEYISTVPITAHQITVDNAEEVAKWCHGSVFHHRDTKHIMGILFGNSVRAKLGDYIFRDVHGPFNSLPAEKFENRYELVQAPAQQRVSKQ